MVFKKDFVVTYLVDDNKKRFYGTVKLSTKDWLESSPEGILKVGKMAKDPKL